MRSKGERTGGREESKNEDMFTGGLSDVSMAQALPAFPPFLRLS